MLKQKWNDNSGPGRLTACPFCNADLTETTPAVHLEHCREFYHAFEKEPPAAANEPESDQVSSRDPDSKYAKASKAAIEQAEKDGKWVGRAPAGFEVVDGYLQVDEEEFTAIADALARVADGESLWSVSRDVDIVHGSTLRRIHADPDRREIFTEQRTNDQRIQAALEEWSDGTETNRT